LCAGLRTPAHNTLRTLRTPAHQNREVPKMVCTTFKVIYKCHQSLD
jgi:hypothetical protein